MSVCLSSSSEGEGQAGAETAHVGGGELAAGGGIVFFKLNSAHQHVWSRRIGSNSSIDGVATFSFANNGDILIGGTTGFTTDLGAGPAGRGVGRG